MTISYQLLHEAGCPRPPYVCKAFDLIGNDKLSPKRKQTIWWQRDASQWRLQYVWNDINQSFTYDAMQLSKLHANHVRLTPLYFSWRKIYKTIRIGLKSDKNDAEATQMSWTYRVWYDTKHIVMESPQKSLHHYGASAFTLNYSVMRCHAKRPPCVRNHDKLLPGTTYQPHYICSNWRMLKIIGGNSGKLPFTIVMS